jgi:hypothetical protein
MITYLRLADCPLGLILNFNNTVMKDGVKRVVNNFPEPRGSGATDVTMILCVLCVLCV